MTRKYGCILLNVSTREKKVLCYLYSGATAFVNQKTNYDWDHPRLFRTRKAALQWLWDFQRLTAGPQPYDHMLNLSVVNIDA